ncbi:hypothetical protein V7S43_001495 [Phytophthora oleae]|uniref:M96 mating-specific protein family n=1 Tax=Phytophthora oleae TaxID=2107226 RepID=A0ABD3G3S6_9STRA
MAFLQEGDGVFEAALSFLDEFATCSTVIEDIPQQILDDTQDAPGGEAQETKRRRGLTDEEKKQRRAEHNERRKLLRKAGVYGDANRARNGRAREITRLREQAEKLQIDLQILQTQSAHKQSKDSNLENECALAKRVPGSQTTGMWQALAEQQRRRLQEVERDNVLLRLAVERQRKVANSLQTQMQRRSTQLTNECASLVTTARANPRSFNVLDFRGDTENFRELFQRLDDAYQKLDQVFMNNGLAGLTLAPGDVHLHERKEKSFEFVSFKVLPFDVRSTAEATWTHFKGVEKHLVNGSLYEKAEKGLDEPYTIIADFKKETFSSSSRADIQVKQVIRRYVEEDRDVVIWVARAGSIEIKHKLLQGLTYHLLGYAVTRRSSESTPDREVSVLQLCYKVSLDQDVPANLQSLTNFLVTTTAENIRAHRERIENALIDRSLRPRVLGQ